MAKGYRRQVKKLAKTVESWSDYRSLRKLILSDGDVSKFDLRQASKAETKLFNDFREDGNITRAEKGILRRAERAYDKLLNKYVSQQIDDSTDTLEQGQGDILNEIDNSTQDQINQINEVLNEIKDELNNVTNNVTNNVNSHTSSTGGSTTTNVNNNTNTVVNSAASGLLAELTEQLNYIVQLIGEREGEEGELISLQDRLDDVTYMLDSVSELVGQYGSVIVYKLDELLSIDFAEGEDLTRLKRRILNSIEEMGLATSSEVNDVLQQTITVLNQVYTLQSQNWQQYFHLWDQINQVAGEVQSILGDEFTAVLNQVNLVGDLVESYGEEILGSLTDLSVDVSKLTALVEVLPDTIRSAAWYNAQRVINYVAGLDLATGQDVLDAVTTITSTIENLEVNLGGDVQTILDAISNIPETDLTGVLDAISDLSDQVGEGFADLTLDLGNLEQSVGVALGQIYNAVDTLEAGQDTILDNLDDILNAINGLDFSDDPTFDELTAVRPANNKASWAVYNGNEDLIINGREYKVVLDDNLDYGDGVVKETGSVFRPGEEFTYAGTLTIPAADRDSDLKVGLLDTLTNEYVMTADVPGFNVV